MNSAVEPFHRGDIIMQYQILKREIKIGRNRYIVKPEPCTTLSDYDIMKDLDQPFNLPFGGNVQRNADGTLQIDIYTC